MKAIQALLITFCISSILVVLLILEGCDPVDARLSIQNKTGKTIYFTSNMDTTISWIRVPYRTLMNDSITTISRHGKGVWEYEFQNDQDHTIHFFILFEETIKHNQDTIRGSLSDHFRYDKRLDLTLEDFKRMNWRIVVE